ncbi:MAG: FAD-dependent oxidoreductase [Granulosicoccus sp.]|nr:FAD-dependent oxidoreductase [Granulosicoccus sp.]
MQLGPSNSVAVVGSGAAGLAAAWLLSRQCRVTLFEKDDRLGGHAHTATIDASGAKTSVESQTAALHIDTGFIVYNELNYPNLSAWFDYLGVETLPTDMSFAVSQEQGRYEYKGGDLAGLFAQPSNVLRPRFWRMLKDLLKFYKKASSDPLPAAEITLREYLRLGDYSQDFINDHLLPFGAAIWSSSQHNMLDYPAATFIRFCHNHGLLQVTDRPQWRTVRGGSQNYVNRVRQQLGENAVITSAQVVAANRGSDGVKLEVRDGTQYHFDHVVLATHADQALVLLEDADAEENRLLSPFEYEQNLAILHTDETLLPRRRKAWASWNYMSTIQGNLAGKPTVSYWMNNLQSLVSERNYIVSLNPEVSPDTATILRSCVYEHPMFTAETLAAQQQLWSLQGCRNTWFCGAYFGAGFHEDAIQSGLAVAEQLAGVKRPWKVKNESGRIVLDSEDYSAAETLVA